MSKYLIRPLAGALGWPLQKLAPVSGRLARDNSRRNPARTAATASALMIGLGVVVFVAVFAQGLKSSFVDSFDKVLRADFVVQSAELRAAARPTRPTQRAGASPGVETAGLRFDAQQVQVAGKTSAQSDGIDPGAVRARLASSTGWSGGSDALLDQLAGDGAVVEEQTASTLGAKVGETLRPSRPMDGERGELKVIGLYRDPMMLNGIIVSNAGYQRSSPSRSCSWCSSRRSRGPTAAARRRRPQDGARRGARPRR